MDARVGKAQGLIELESSVAAPNYAPLAVVLERGEGSWLWDADGKRYLDFMSAYSAVSHGHAHPRLVRALIEQAQRVAVTSRAYHSTELAPFLAKLVEVADLGGEVRALPASGGCESVETAIKAARRWGYRVKGIEPDRAEIVTARGNFHGRSTTVVGFSSEDDYRADFGPFAPGFRHFAFGDIAGLKEAINERTCAVLIEPIQGEAGIVTPPPGFLRAARELCTERNVLLIIDEIQSGLGRTGAWFAYMHEGIRPDAVIVGKALGGGLLPVSALVARAPVLDLMGPGSHGSTFGGNPLAARVALEALRVIEDEKLVERSRELGAHLLDRLRHLRSPLIRAVRGRGLWAGVELTPDVSARAVVERLAERGVLTKDTHGSVVRFAPPLTISRAALDWGLDVFTAVLAEFGPRTAPPFSRSSDAHITTLQPRRNDDVTATSQVARSVRPSAHLMMCPPRHFEVSYTINPWMDPSQWSVAADRLADDARRGWIQLKTTYERLGARVSTQSPARGLPDMVFTANAAVVLDRKVLLARFLCPERRGEEAHDRKFFEALRDQGRVDDIVGPPPGLYFEGAGDAIWDASRGLIWTGYGQRSSRGMHAVIESFYGVPTVPLELIDPRFYHLDTCFCVLSEGEILWYPGAFSEEAAATVRRVAGAGNLIEATDEDALHLGVNSVCLGRDVVMCHASDATRAALTARGYRVHVVPLDSFNRSGGAAYCLTLRLDNVTRAVRCSDDERAEGFAQLRRAA
ncbi:MAG TPA: ornithine--oxo-acid transaminase [Burkholderiaceae bacterium]|nr:ornithine--oxo-acid transaminase [Burkholderiaceae bacterium]